MTTISEAFLRNAQEMDSNGNYTSIETVYFVFDADDEEEAFSAVYSGISSTYQGVALSSVSLDERINETIWKFVVSYQSTSSGAEGGTVPDSTISFDTTGGSETVFQSEGTDSYPGSAPFLNNAIGWDGERVNGVDVVIPRYSWSETHYFTDAECSAAYRLTLARNTGTVNNASFRGFEGGEVLFTGARGSKQSTDSDALWEVEFTFQYSKNEEFPFDVGGIEVTSKGGWHYMWVEYEEDVDGSEYTIIASPKYVRLEKIYDEIDFSVLGIGTA